MQRVISRVHQIVTSASDAPSSSAAASLEGLAAAATPTVPPSSREGPIGSAIGNPAPTLVPMTPVAAVVTPSAAQHKEITLAVERLQYATLLGERKKAVASLQDLARSYSAASSPSASANGDDGKRQGRSTPHHVALGLAAIPAVLNALLTDPRDTELMEALLELLQAFVSTSPATATAMLKSPPKADANSTGGSLRSASAATVSISGTQLCLQLLQDPSPWIRGPTIALVKSLQEAQQKEFAASVLDCKEGLRRLLEVVEDKREHIRDAALQVLVKMTEREKNVQQFLAFEDGFVRLFQIMEVEGLREGSSVVSDCLQIVNNMLRDNLMNQTLFRDLPYLATHLPQLLSLPSTPQADVEVNDAAVAPSALKSTQRKRTMKLVLQLVRFLVSELYEGVSDSKLDELALRDKARKHQDIAQVQSMITRQRELMGAIGEIVCCGNEELTDLQLQALDMIQLLCSGNGGNQIILVNLLATPSRRSLLSELIKLDIAEEETPVGAAATTLLDVLLKNNESAKMAIFQHLNAPPPIDDEDASLGGVLPPIPAGRVLLDALITNAEAVMGGKTSDTKRSVRSSTILAWKACHRFASLIGDSAYCKELALRIPSQFDQPDAQAVSGDLFITRCLKILGGSFVSKKKRSSAEFQVKVAILTMLIQWCVDCTKAVQELVGSVTTLSILIDTLGFQQEDETSASNLSPDEMSQIRGLMAILLGVCLEFLVPIAEDDSRTEVSSVTPQITRHNLVDLISKKIGLESFANMLIHFQQSPQVVACARTASKHQRARALLAHQALYSRRDGEVEELDGYLFPLYDRSFTVLCRDIAGKIQHRVLWIFTSSDEDEVHSVRGNNVNVPTAASAYQDLIRMQDKQIQDLERQISDLTTQLEASTISSSTTDTKASTSREHSEHVCSSEHRAELEQLLAAHNKEKTEMDRKLAIATEQLSALDSRFQGLTRAFEQLEAEHSRCGRITQGSESRTSLTSAPTDAMAQVMADLERETNERRRLEDALRTESQRRLDRESKATQDAHALQMTNLQLQQELDSVRSSLMEREEQLSEQVEMIDVFRQGQESAKRSAAQLKAELDQVNQELNTFRSGRVTTEDSPASKHEAAAKEMYELWEKERAKVRDLTKELEKLNQELANVASRSQVALTQRDEHDCQDAHVSQNVGAPDSVPVGVQDLELLKRENEELRTTLEVLKSGKDLELSQLNGAMGDQLQDINQLRDLLKEMQHAVEAASEEAAKKDKVIEELNEELMQAEERAQEQRRKAKTTMAELEGEIARMFFEKTEAHRKSKASLKQAEQEIARVFLEKVELEKQIAGLQNASGPLPEISAEASTHSTSDGQLTVPRSGSDCNADVRPPLSAKLEVGLDEATAMEDMFIVLASLEIQCNTFRECLEAAQGERAVTEAIQMSRKRGALAV